MSDTLRQPVFLLVAVTIAVGVLSGCAEPVIPQTDSGDADTGAEQPEQFDPLGDALTDAVNELTVTMQEIQTVLSVNSADRDVLHSAADDALEQLLYAERAVFPKPRAITERDTASDDLLSAVLTAARQVGGVRGDSVTAAIRDTLAGDLGAWERDPDGMRTQALTAYGTSVEATRAAVGALDADGMRAVAWLAFARQQTTPDTIRTAFEYASVHLDMVLLSVAAAQL